MRKHPKSRGSSIIRNSFRAAFTSQILFLLGAAYVYQNAENKEFRFSMHKNCNWVLNCYYTFLDRLDAGSGSALKEQDQSVWAERRR